MEKVVESVNETLRKEIQELRQSIQSTVETVVANIKQRLEDRVSSIEAKVRELEEIATVMSDQVSQNIDHITSLTSDLTKFDHETILAEIQTIRANANKGVLIANDSEQYSRRNSLRIRGLSCEGTSTMSAVLNFLGTKLDVKDISPEDIIAAHPLPINLRSSTSRPQIPTILLRFRNRQLRNNVIRKRKLLKGSVYSVDEDLTALNIQLVNRLRLSDRVTKTWSWNGEIYATLDNNKTVIAKPLSSIDELFSFPALRNKSNYIFSLLANSPTIIYSFR